jgi:exonuclease SbcC
MTGLRSYRAETSVDFSDLNLLAIVGATGSGKSSLLEAITYALYGTATWGGGNVKALIADGAISMSVSLSFEADGQRWQITRKASRAAYPGSSQELKCLSDPGRQKIDGAADVKKRVRELIGLDYVGFRSCVLLPQGRFDQLLKSAPAHRVSILKGILGLDSLEAVRGRAQELEQLVSARFEAILKARGQFLPDPRATHDACEKEIVRLTPRMEQLTRLEERVQNLVIEVAEHRRAAETHSESADRLAGLIDAELLDRLRALEQLEDELLEARSAAAADAEAAEHKARRAKKAVADARQNGRNSAAIIGLQAKIAAAHTELEGIAEALARLERARTQLATDHEHLLAERARATELARVQKQQTEDEQQAYAMATQAGEAAAAVTAQIHSLVAARKKLATAEADMRDRSTKLGLAQQHAKAALQRHQEADVAHSAALAEADKAHRIDAAARAAHGCRPGDSCPVCAQLLPEDFAVPETSVDLTVLDEACAAARQIERAALTALSQAQAAEKAAADWVEAATRTRDVEMAAWLELQATPLPSFLDPESVVADEATLALVNEPAAEAVRKHRTAHDALKTTSREHQQIDAEVNATARALAAREADVAIESDRSEGRKQGLRAALGLLPDWVGAAESADVAALTECSQGLSVALEEAEAREQLAETAGERAVERQRALAALKERMNAEVERPAVNERNALCSLAGELDRHREQPMLPGSSSALTSADLSAWGKQVVDASVTTLRTLQARVDREQQDADTKRQEGLALLRSSSFDKSTELRDAVIDVAGAIKRATSERQRAAAQLEPVKRLDTLGSRAEQLRAGLRELSFQLGDGKFVGFVVEQRQRALLALASGILGEVTSGQYGFTEDFEIVDRQTGTSRTPDTLSGGETFLASLALALGLVELAGRSGGRLQALFLDEGFGSLDPDALDQALNELERRADAGRMIALISHVPAIAERIEQVLQVTKTPQGSELRLLSADERATMLLDDATELAASTA